MSDKPFGWITNKSVASVRKQAKSHLPEYMTIMVRNTQYGEAQVPIYLGVAPTMPVIDAGNALATLAFNLCQDKNLLPEHAAALKRAYKTWDDARRIS